MKPILSNSKSLELLKKSLNKFYSNVIIINDKKIIWKNPNTEAKLILMCSPILLADISKDYKKYLKNNDVKSFDDFSENFYDYIADKIKSSFGYDINIDYLYLYNFELRKDVNNNIIITIEGFIIFENDRIYNITMEDTNNAV